MDTYLSEITTLLPIYWWVFLGTAVIAYLLGSINPAVIVTRVWTKGKKDIRDMGSGNAGFTNVLRSVGKVPAIITIVCDALKCVAAVLLGGLFFSLMLSNHYGTQDSVLNLQLVNLGKYIAGIFCILGHSFPLYFHFKGGKGVVSPYTFLATFLFDYQLGSGFYLSYVILSTAAALIIGIFVTIKHKENIGRLLRGEEKKIKAK